MGHVYYQEIDLTLIDDATQDIWSLVAGSANKVKLLGFELSSNAVAEALLKVTLTRITAAGSGGSASTTEEPANEASPAATAGVRTLDTTPGTAGNGLMSWQWEQLGAIGHVYTPEMAPVSKVSEGFALTCDTASVTSAVSGYICWEEF